MELKLRLEQPTVSRCATECRCASNNDEFPAPLHLCLPASSCLRKLPAAFLPIFAFGSGHDCRRPDRSGSGVPAAKTVRQSPGRRGPQSSLPRILLGRKMGRSNYGRRTSDAIVAEYVHISPVARARIRPQGGTRNLSFG